MNRISSLKILFVQRVITNYRLELIKVLCKEFKEVGVVTSKGNSAGTLKLAKIDNVEVKNDNLKIHLLPSIRLNYTGESRSTNFFIYPKSVSLIKNYDVIVLEGTTNLLNNGYLVPVARLLRKKTIWWDAGYSLPTRSFKRKLIDLAVTPLIRMTHGQMAYSTLAKNYLANHMGARNAFLNLNTINTSYFESISTEINKCLKNYEFTQDNIKLLYVGVIEERKKIKELIDIVIRLNNAFNEHRFTLKIIGGGSQLQDLINYVKDVDFINLKGPIYDKEILRDYYLSSDLFVLPGDGGLAILQSLLYGLPVLSIIGADGTELDYITDKRFLVRSLDEMEVFLKNLKEIDRKKIIKETPNIKHENWVGTLTNFISTL